MTKKILIWTAAAAMLSGISTAHSQTISIRNAVNFGLTDNGIKGDGRGGFTDDGVNLAPAYKDGINTVYGEKFDLIRPENNNGKAVLTFECEKSKTGLREVVLDLDGQNVAGESLNLLHTSTKSPDVRYTRIGKIEITYADGKKKEILLEYAIDVMNALQPKDRANAKVWRPSDASVPAYYFSRIRIEPKRIKSLKLSTCDIATWVVAGISVSKKYPKFVPSPAEWVETDISDIAIAEGSALDLSKNFDSAPAGKFGRVIVSKRGKFAFEKRPKAKLKFHGTVWYLAGERGKDVRETKENLKKLCQIAKRQGYNLLRFHTSDFLCSTDPAKLAEGFDLYDYLISEAKKNGIYLNLLIGNNVFDESKKSWDARFSTKMKMLMGDEKTRKDWEAHARKQLDHINPYTGLAWKEDPVFMGMEFWNEMDLLYVFRQLDAETVALANSEFAKYAEAKYGTVENMNATGKFARKDYKKFGEIDFANESETSEWVNFCKIKNDEFRKFCEKVVKTDIGYDGLIYQYNCNRTLNMAYMSSEIADYSTLNVYFKHPSNFTQINSHVGQESSLSEASGFANTMRAGVARKISGRPICLTEYNHCHWNQYKHEGGLVFGAYAALQDFDGMIVHCDGVKTGAKKGNVLGPFSVSKSPVFRANEFLTYCLFMRGDAKKSKHRVELFFPKNYVENNANMSRSANGAQTRIALLSGFSVKFEGARIPEKLAHTKIKKPDMTMLPVGASLTSSAQNFSSTGASIGEKFDEEAFVMQMRKNGILDENNCTSPAAGVYHSDTNQILLDAKKESISAITPKTEAVAFKKGVENLDALTEISSTVPCAVAACSVDGSPLSESKRIVFIYNTDNINSDINLDVYRTVLLKNPSPNSKILIRRGKMSAKLRVPADAKYKMYELKYNGERRAEIPLANADGELSINIDNSKNPSTFFEIVAE